MLVALRYVNRQLLAVFAVTLAMLLLVAVGGRFIGYLQEAALGKYTGTTVLTIMYLRLPEFVQLVAPFALYVATILTLGRLYADQEMVVFQGAGTGPARLLSWLAAAVGVVVGAVAVFALVLTPWANRSLEDYMKQARARTEFETVNPGAFHAYDRGRRVTYSEAMSADRRTLHNVFMSQRLEDGRQVTLWANEGTQFVDADSGIHYLVLRQGKRYEVQPGQTDLRIMAFDELRQKLNVFESTNPGDYEATAKPLAALGRSPPERAEWHWRVGMPLFALIGVLLAVGISRTKPRQGRFARVVPGMLLMLFYYLALLLNRNVIEEEQLPAQFGLWAVHAVFLGAALWLLHRLPKPVKQ